MWNGSSSQVERLFLERTNSSYPLLLKAGDVGRLYGLGHTSYVLVDHEGIVSYISNFNVQTFNPREVRRAIDAALRALADSQHTVEATDTAIGARESMPDRFTLLANFPNPFNAETSIGFHLDAETDLALQVFDAAGRPVRRLAAGRFGAGTYQVRWDGQDRDGHPVSSGVYFYRLSSTNHRATRSMVLLR